MHEPIHDLLGRAKYEEQILDAEAARLAGRIETRSLRQRVGLAIVRVGAAVAGSGTPLGTLKGLGR